MRKLLSPSFMMRALTLAAALAPALSFADSASFNNLTTAEYDSIVKELSANFSYSSLTPASSLGGLGGFEIGLVGGVTQANDIRDIVRAKGNANFKQKWLPHAGALARIGVPYGLTAEALIFPKVTVSDFQLSQYGGAVAWTVTDVFLKELPVNIMVKGFYTKTKFGVKQQVRNTSGVGPTNVDGRVSFDNSLLGGQLLVSKKLLVFEPYLGVGYAKAKGEVNVTTDNIAYQGNIFAVPGVSGISKPTSAQLMAGLDIRLGFFTLGGEIQRSFGTTSATGRLSFRF